MNQALTLMEQTKVVPVIQINEVADAAPLAKALMDNGLPIAEVTLRSEAALESIRIMRETCPELLVIAGTVITPEQAEQAYEAGAQLVVSPGFNPRTIEFCQKMNIPVIPGVATPGEMEQAMNFGLSVLKFFPAEANGGVTMLKAVSAPYQKLRFMPTGGITTSNINSYLALPNVVCCGGSWMIDKELIAQGKWDELGSLIQQAVAVCQ